MELLIALLVVLAITGTVRSVRHDGRGHTPIVRSTAPWSAGDLPSMPYSMGS